ncbi:TIGR03749 family integrating conjugative element protein [Escherichia coli]|uniref:TIGR03749 family integrating conjugative element protein n=1 Tax=Escherichia coli TaxID=562 RepID=UPI00044830F2|nr:TIGR03749 family integrating conjugative element protein [Escherichia coli]EZJ63237.1 hypothetical protein AC93_5146 [Escherichia coli 2-005-03_S4_C2]
MKAGIVCSLLRPAVMMMSLSVLSLTAQADELMKWERIPLNILLKVGQERVIFADKNVRVGFPPALNGKLRVQSTGGAVYLKADSAFPQTRVQLQDVESGEMILLDVTAGEKGTTEPVRIVYDGDVSTVSRAAGSDVQTVKSRSSNGKAGMDNGTQARRTEPRYAELLPVLLTRYAAQSLYAPLRTLEPVAGIRPVVPHLPRQITTVYPSEPLTVSPVAAWAAGGRTVVALKLTSTVSRRIVLDPRALQGRFVAATFQHRWLGAAGTPEDTTMLYVVTAGSPEKAFVEGPVTSRRGGEGTHAD